MDGIARSMPVLSMTGFGAAFRDWTQPGAARGRLDVEVRAVNGRFLDIRIRQPFGSGVDAALRAAIARHLGRGRVELLVHLRALRHADSSPTALGAVGLDSERLSQAVEAARVATQYADQAGLEVSSPTPLDLLRFAASIRSDSSEDRAEAPPFFDEVVEEALRAVVELRTREGFALEQVLRTLADELHAYAETLADQAPGESKRIAERVDLRLAELTSRAQVTPLDPDRVAQEVAAIVMRGDIEEELTRIASHLAQLRRTLDAEPKPGQGKTLDFITQELQREFTTIGSKVTAHDGSQLVIAAKAVIERIREQVQNVE